MDETKIEFKLCSRCNPPIPKPIDQFGIDNRTGQPKSVCRPCDVKIHRLLYQNNQEYRANSNAISSERYYEKKKRGKCHICGEKTYGRIYCDKHSEERAAANRSKNLNRERICPGCNTAFLGLKRRLCTECSNPNNPVFRAKQKKWRDALKLEVFTHYGLKCACCEEKEYLFLSIDHINNDGAQHRRQLLENCANKMNIAGTKFYAWIRKNKYPDDLQLLCMNCNFGKKMNGGICPHKTKQKELETQ